MRRPLTVFSFSSSLAQGSTMCGMFLVRLDMVDSCMCGVEEMMLFESRTTYLWTAARLVLFLVDTVASKKHFPDNCCVDQDPFVDQNPLSTKTLCRPKPFVD